MEESARNFRYELHFDTISSLGRYSVTENYSKLEDLLRAFILDFGDSGKTYFPLMSFAYNNNFRANISMTLYEALYGRKYRYPLYWFRVEKRKFFRPLSYNI